MKKLSVMVVDDDKLLLESLIDTLDWEKYGFEIVATAYNGKQALSKFNKYNPQVIITDIVMPVMDGLALSREIRKTNKQCAIIFLTSHDDFRFAKQAVAMGIENYILKNEITPETLSEILLSVKKKVQTDIYSSNAYFQRLLSDFMQNKNPEFPDELSYKQLLFKNQYCFILLVQDMPLPIDAGCDYEPSAIPGFIHLDVELNNRFGVKYCVPIGLKHVLFIIEPPSGVSSPASFLKVLSQQLKNFYLDKVRPEVKETFILTAIYYQDKETIFSFKKQYEAVNLTWTNVFHGSDQIIPLHQLLFPAAENHVILNIDRELQRCFSDKGIAAADFLVSLKADLQASMIGQIAISICRQIFDQLIKKWHLLQESIIDMPAFEYHPQYSLDDCLDWFLELIDTINLLQARCHDTLRTPSVQQSIKYIRKNYGKNSLSMAEICNQTKTSIGYMSTLFKKETGYTVNEYITSIRLEKAKDLLLKTNLKVYEISEMVGYSSSQYFSQLFLTYTKKTPSEFRRSFNE